MKFFVPPLKTVFRLKQTWNFELHYETRNETLWNLFSAIPMEGYFNRLYSQRRRLRCDVCLSPDDELTVDRIFIRKGSSEYNSVTFRGKVKYDGVYHNVRFWVPLSDVNGIEMEVIHR